MCRAHGASRLQKYPRPIAWTTWAPEPESSTHRPYRPPIGIPTPGEPRARATVASVVVHVLLALLILAPTLIYLLRLSLPPHFEGCRRTRAQRRRRGRKRWHGGLHGPLHPWSASSIVRWLPRHRKRSRSRNLPKPKPEEKKVVEPLKPPPPVPAPVEDPKPAASLAPAGLDPKGDGVGTGRDGSAGNGPGRGGGVGAAGHRPGVGEWSRHRGWQRRDLPANCRLAPHPAAASALEGAPVQDGRRVRGRLGRECAASSSIRRATQATIGASARCCRRFASGPAVRMDGTPVAAIAVVTAEAM